MQPDSRLRESLRGNCITYGCEGKPQTRVAAHVGYYAAGTGCRVAAGGALRAYPGLYSGALSGRWRVLVILAIASVFACPNANENALFGHGTDEMDGHRLRNVKRILNLLASNAALRVEHSQNPILMGWFLHVG